MVRVMGVSKMSFFANKAEMVYQSNSDENTDAFQANLVPMTWDRSAERSKFSVGCLQQKPG